MTHTKVFTLCLLIFSMKLSSAQDVIPVKHFDKIIVSPHIAVHFIKGNEEKATILNSGMDKSKLHIDVNNGTLHIYLDGAKYNDRNETTYENGYREKHSIYEGTVVTATIEYKTLNELSIRGEEEQVCESPLNGDKFTLKIYGESTVTLNEVHLNELQATIYGESSLEINSGTIKFQKYTSYGEGKINSVSIKGNSSHITAYGEAEFNINVSDDVKITAFGEAKLRYKGNPTITKGLHFGELHIKKLDADL